TTRAAIARPQARNTRRCVLARVAIRRLYVAPPQPIYACRTRPRMRPGADAHLDAQADAVGMSRHIGLLAGLVLMACGSQGTTFLTVRDDVVLRAGEFSSSATVIALSNGDYLTRVADAKRSSGARWRHRPELSYRPAG